MQEKIHRSTFESTWEQLVPLPILRKIFKAYGSPKRRPAKLKPWALIKGMIFPAIQGTGTLAANVKAATDRKISDSALAQRRARLGWEPFEWILQAALVRIPTVSDTRSETFRTVVPILIGHFSERSDAADEVIKKCPKRVKFSTPLWGVISEPEGRRQVVVPRNSIAPSIRAGGGAAATAFEP